MGCCESSRPHVPHARHERQYSNPAMTLPVGYTPGEGKPYVPLHEAQPARKAIWKFGGGGGGGEVGKVGRCGGGEVITQLDQSSLFPVCE